MQPISWLSIALVSTALAQFAFKLYFHKRERRRLLAIALALFVAAPYATYRALEELSLATVYVATAASQLLIVALSLTILREKYTLRQYGGLVLVLTGIVLYNT